LGPVSKTDEYAAYALTLFDLAEWVGNPSDQLRLLEQAEAWLDLVDRMQARSQSKRRKVPDHPLVKAQLGDEHTDA
jgi:hypothetical protein